MTAQISPYGLVGPRLVEMGYSAIPIIPGTKAPGTLRNGEASAVTGWADRFCHSLPNDFEVSSWAREEAGVGVACGFNGLAGIDIDTDDRVISSAVMGVLPATPVRKAGMKGLTLFYRAPGLASQSFDVRGPSGRPTRAVDIIAVGRQSLLPPTLHPDTGRPYCWVGEQALDEIEPQDLPELPPDIAEHIAAVLRPFGYDAFEKKPNLWVASDAGENTPFQAVNDAAMANFAAWVPHLGLCRLKATRQGYEAVPTWRPSSTGRPTEQRKLNLKIHPSGIRDFGAPPAIGGYSPIDLVMRACDCDVDVAFKSLAEWTGWSTGEVIEVAARPRLDAPQGEADPSTEAQRPLSVFLYGHREVAPPPWLIEGVLPQGELAILAGQSSAGKTFIGIDLSFSVMTGHPFIDHVVARRGGVLWLAAEGQSEVMVRLKAAALFRTGETLEKRLPFAQQAFDVPSLSDRLAKTKILALIDDARALFSAEFPGTDLVLIVIDTLNGAAGFQDENSASETQRVMNLLREVSVATGALVLMIDHHGKVAETGIRGSSAKRGAADAVLSALADKSGQGLVENRRLAVEKLRGAPTGRVVPFVLAPVDIDDAGTQHCAVAWSPQTADREFIVPKATMNPASPWKGNSRLFKAAIDAVLDQAKEIAPFGSEGSKVKAVKIDQVRDEFYASYPAEDAGTKRKAFNRLLSKARETPLVGSREIAGTDWIWLL